MMHAEKLEAPEVLKNKELVKWLRSKFASDFVVQGNTKASLHTLTIFSSSKEDVLIYKPYNKQSGSEASIVSIIGSNHDQDEVFGSSFECKLKSENSKSQLIAYMLKLAADITFEYAWNGIDCNLVNVYGLALIYSDNKATIYKMTIDFKAQPTKLDIHKSHGEHNINEALAYIYKKMS